MRRLAVILLALMLSGCFASFSSRGSAVAPTPPGSSAAVVTRTGGNAIQVNSQGAQVRMDLRTYLGVALVLGVIDGVNYLHHALKAAFSSPPATAPQPLREGSPAPGAVETGAPAPK
ncbi:MAG: hypothetical protein HYU77_08810 [Betaproteobacteria bacterium]|nr:hypothetical protein [Betaproteobacteria bacterium]